MTKASTLKAKAAMLALMWAASLTSSHLAAAKASSAASVSTTSALADAWSIQQDVAKAVSEAADRLRKPSKSHNGMKDPDFVMALFTSEFNAQSVADELGKQFPGKPVFGYNVYQATFTSEGLHVPKKGVEGTIALLGIKDPTLKVGLAVVETDVLASDEAKRKLTDQLLNEAIKNAQVPTEKANKPSLVLMSTGLPMVDAFLATLNATSFSKDTPLVGGTTLNSDFAPGKIFANGKAYDNAAVVALLYSDKKVGSSFHGGYVGNKVSGVVTKVDLSRQGTRLIEINNRPALDVYNEWAKGAFNEEIKQLEKDKKSFYVMKNTVTPLAKLYNTTNGERYVTIHPFEYNPDKSMTLGQSVQVGETIYYVEGSREVLVNRVEVVVKRAMADGAVKIADVAGGIHIFCSGAGAWIGMEENAEKMVGNIIKSMPARAPFIGGFAGGEQGTLPGKGFFAGNLMSVQAVFGHSNRE